MSMVLSISKDIKILFKSITIYSQGLLGLCIILGGKNIFFMLKKKRTKRKQLCKSERSDDVEKQEALT